MKERILSGILSVFSGKIGVTLLGAIITPLLVRILGTDSYGDYAVIISVYSVMAIFLRAGISSGVRKYIAESRDNMEWQSQVFGFYFRIAMLLSIFGGFILIILSEVGVVNIFFEERFSTYFLVLSAVVVCEQLMYVSRYTLMGLQLEEYSESLNVLKDLIFGVIGLSLAYIGFSVVGILLGKAIGALFSALIALWVLNRVLDLQTITRRADKSFPRKKLLKYNVENTIFIFLTASLYNVDILLLQPLSGSEQTGLYKSALVSAELVWIVPIVIQTVFLHSSSEMWADNKIDQISELASKATRYTLSFTLLLVVGLGILSEEFVYVYFGSEFQDAVDPLLYLLPGVVGFAVARPIFAIGMGKGDFKVLIIATGLAALINLILNLLLIPQFGMVGAAVATSIGYSVMIVFHIWSAYQIGFNPLIDLRPIRIAISTLFTAGSVFTANVLIPSTILSLIIVPPIGFVVYLISSTGLGVINKDDIKDLTSHLKP